MTASLQLGVLRFKLEVASLPACARATHEAKGTSTLLLHDGTLELGHHYNLSYSGSALSALIAVMTLGRVEHSDTVTQ